MRKPSALILIRFGVLLTILSGPPAAVPATADLAAQASSPTSNAPPAADRKTGDHQSLAAVSSVLVQSGGAGKTWVDISSSVPAAYHVEHMDHPWRVVVDVKDSRDRTSQHLYPVQSPVLKQVKVEQYRAEPGSHVVRVVAVLVSDTAFDVQQRPGGFRIELEARPRARDVAPPRPAGGGSSASSPVAKPAPHPQEASSVHSPASPPGNPATVTGSSAALSKPQQSDSGLRTKAKGQPPSLGLKSSALAAVPSEPRHEPVPVKSGSTAPPKAERADTSIAGAKPKPPLVAKVATPSRPESRVARPSALGLKSSALAAVPSEPKHEPVPARSGSTAPPKAEPADTPGVTAEANGSRALGPRSAPMAQVATPSGPEPPVPSSASPGQKPAIPPGGTTSPVPQVALAHTGEVATPKSQTPTDSGAAAASQGQTFETERIPEAAALVPARAAAPANPGRTAQSDRPVLQAAAAAGGGAPTQQGPQNPPASGQPSAPSTGSQAVTLVPEASVPTAAPPKYTGDLVSMNLKDVDIKDFFRMIHEVSGLNIVIDSGVTGAVTMVLDRVPWDQALDLVLRDNGLGKVLEGNVVRISKLETLEKEQEDNVKLADAREGAEPLVTVIIPLKYASAIDRTPTQATITSAGGAGGGMGGGGGGTSQQQNIIIPGVVSILTGRVSSGGSSGGGGAIQGRSVLSKRGSAIPDTRNNSIILTEVPSRIALVESIIAKLDTPAKQVSIEARIVVANSDFVRSLQSALNFGTVNPSGSTVTGGATGTGATAQGNVPGSTSSSSASPPRVTIGQTAASGFGAFAISNQSLRYFINAAIAAAETRDQAKVISAPSVVTQNNWPAVVMQGVQIPIQTTVNNTISTQFVDAALTLQVTPTVTEGGHLFLQLSVANNSVGAVLTGAAGPSINTQAATTQVMVPDGGTVVFGGVKVTSRTRSVTQVPVLGGIPMLGNLFKSSNLEDNDQELLFFVSPKILPE